MRAGVRRRRCTSASSPAVGTPKACASRARLDATLDVVLLLHDRTLRRDEAEHRHLALWQEAQGLEAAGPLAVVFEEVAGHIDLVEQEIRDRLVAAFRHPGAGEVPAAQMHAD